MMQRHEALPLDAISKANDYSSKPTNDMKNGCSELHFGVVLDTDTLCLFFISASAGLVYLAAISVYFRLRASRVNMYVCQRL